MWAERLLCRAARTSRQDSTGGLMKGTSARAIAIAALICATLAGSAAPAAAADKANGSAADHADYYRAKAALDANTALVKTVTVSGSTLTITYTSLFSGGAIVLAEPVQRTSKGIQPQFSVVGCGWFDVCIRLDRTDQAVLAAGGAAWLAVAICAVPAVGWISCATVTAALTIAAGYIAVNGLCRSTLQVGLLPPGRDFACW